MNEAIMAKMDDDIYGSLKSQFEHIMFAGFEKARQGDLTYTADMRILLEVFNNSVDDCKRLVQRVRKLENERG